MNSKHEATNICRRLLRALGVVPDGCERAAKKCARTLDPEDIRSLADAVFETTRLHPRPGPAVVHYHGDPIPPPKLTPPGELRGIARAIITYGGPDKVRADCDPVTSEMLLRMGWTP